MMKKMLTIAALGIQAAFTLAHAQPLKIGFVDLDQVLRESAPSKAAGARLESEFGPRNRELASLDAQLRAAGEKLEKDSPALSEDERNRRSRDIASQQRELERKARQFQEDAERRQQEEQGLVRDKVDKAVKQVFDSEKYDLILQDGARLHTPALDITKKVLDALNARK